MTKAAQNGPGIMARRFGAYLVACLFAASNALIWDSSRWEGGAIVFAVPVVIIVTALPYLILRTVSAIRAWDGYLAAALGGLICGALAYALVVPTTGQRYSVIVIDLSLPFLLALGAASGMVCYWVEGRFTARATRWTDGRYREDVASQVSALVTAPLELSWAVFVPIDLRDLFKGHRPLPAVVEVMDQTGPWDVAGSTRSVGLSDGRQLSEEVSVVKLPDGEHARFASVVRGFSGVIGALTSKARVHWDFEAESPNRTTIDLTYSFMPRNPAARVLLILVVRFLWRPYMTAALENLRAQITDAQARA